MKKLLSALALVFTFCAPASAFPDKDLKVIVPFAPGGGVDVTIRFLSEVAPKYLNGKKLIVENMPGGGAVIGQTAVAKAKPDGYTILAYTSSVVSNPLQKKTTFKYSDFTPIAMYCFDPGILFVPANSPFKTLKDFIEASKKEEIVLAMPGHSTAHHIGGQMLEKHFGSKLAYIQLTSAAQQMAQVLGGHVQGAMFGYGEATSYVKEGSIRILGMMSDAQYPGAEKIERFSSLGLNLEWGAFRGVAVPAGTPKNVVKILSDAFVGMAKDPEFVERMTKAGFPMQVYDSQEFSKYVDEVAKIYNNLLKPESK